MIRSGLRRVASGVKRRIVRRLHREPPVRSAASPVSAPAASGRAVAPEPAAAGSTRDEPVAPTSPFQAADVAVAPSETASTAAATEDADALTREAVWELFEDMVRPALQADGGDIDLVKVEDNDVHVRLLGACRGCPSSTITMRQGIERLLREEFPQFRDLIEVDGGPGLQAALEAATP